MQSVRFGLWNPAQLKSHSVAEIVSRDLFDKKGDPVPGGLYDLRLGTVSRDQICATCHGDIVTCPGHIGHLDLHVPVYHVLLLKPLLRILQCVCPLCFSLLTSERPGSFSSLHKACRLRKTCEGCECAVPKYEVNKGVLFRTSSGEEAERLSPNDCYVLLCRIREEDVASMHLSYHPKHLMITRFPIPPPQTHPPIAYGVRNSFDDLTNKLVDIIRTNQSIVDCEESRREGYADALQMHVSMYLDSDSVPITGRSTRPFKGLAQRLKSKEGRIRGNLNGKRVNFSARTVLTGDATLRLEEVGVPACIAHTLTFPIGVTTWNKKNLERMIARKEAKTLVRANGTTLDLRIAKEPVKLYVGDTVERTLRDGDPVVFNRQPTLHRMSMMCHYVRVLPGKTFRINLSATSPYNADCDGDELNIHVPQNYEAWSEMTQLMDVRRHVVSSQANRPVIGLVQDTMLAMYRMTHPDVWIPRAEVMQMMMACGWTTRPLPVPATTKPVPLWSGCQLVSMCLPSIDLDGDVTVRSGTLLRGRLTKKCVGGNGGLVHTVWLTRGPHVCGHMLSEMQFLAHAFTLWRSFSVGLQDMVYGIENQAHLERMIQKQVDESMELIQRAQRKGLGRDAIEPRIVETLDYARDSTGVFVRDGIPESNNLKQMVNSGAKGNNINIAQICSCVGLQHIEGKRPDATFDQTRCLSQFKRGDMHPKANGFIRSSYLQGLDPAEFFFHAMAGREGVIDTAIRTSETGYVQREFVKLMEDIKVAYDGTVRDSSDEIIQFLFGGDGIDPTFVQQQKVDGRSYALPFVLEDVCKRARLEEEESDAEESIAWEDVPEPVAHVMQRYDDRTQRLMWREIEQARIQPGTSVGIIAAQSLGEVSTQLALNSVTWETRIHFWMDGRWMRTPIGAFVDAHVDIAKAEGTLQQHPNGTEWVDFPSTMSRRFCIESVDERGQTRWTRIEGVSRHPVQNEDDTDTVVRFRTASGRSITVTKAKGMLKKVGARICGVTSKDVHVGDYVPIAGPWDPFVDGTASLETACDLRSYLSDDPHLVFERDVHETLSTERSGSAFVYERSPSSIRDALFFTHGSIPRPKRRVFGIRFEDPHSGRFDWIPDRLRWSRSLGFVLGACWASGRIVETQALDAMEKTLYLSCPCPRASKSLTEILRSWGVHVRVKRHSLDASTNAVSRTVVIKSYPWIRFLETLGLGSSLRRRVVPEVLYRVPVRAVRGFWDGYLSFHAETTPRWTWTIPCLNERFLEDALHLLARLHIEAYCIERNTSRTERVVSTHAIALSGYWSNVFWNEISWTRRNLRHVARCESRKLEHRDALPERVVPDVRSSKTKGRQTHALADLVRIRDAWMRRSKQKDSACYREVENALSMTCWFDRIVEKEETHPSMEHPLMYDLTVEGTRNFCTASRLVVRDSFHHSGTAGSITSGGVPRLKRLIHASKDSERNVWAPVLPGVDASDAYAKYKRTPLQSLVLSHEVVPWNESTASLPWQSIEPTERVLKLHCNRVRMLEAGYTVADMCAVLMRDMDKCTVWGTHLNAPKVEIYIAIKNKSMIGLFRSEMEDLTMHRGHDTLREVRPSEDGLLFENASLLDVFDCPEICAEKAITTSVIEAFEVLGVEAARTVFLVELKRVFETAGTYLNDHHYTLLADVMFQPGRPMPVSRHGVRDTKGVLGKASFETTIDTLFTAAMNQTKDRLRGVSERIITGTRIQAGTGSFDVFETPQSAHVDETEPDSHEYVYVPSSPDWDPCVDANVSRDESDGMVTTWVPF